MAFPTGWTSLELQSDHTKVSGSANLTDFPALISSANIPSAVYAGLNQGEIYSSWLDGDTGIKAYYRGESGALTTDSSGNSKTLTNNNTVGEASGRFGGAFSLGTSNTNKSMTTTDQLGFTHGSVKVIIARVKCTGQPGTNVRTHPAYIVTGSAGNGHGFGISYRDSAGTKKVGVNTYGSAGSTTREIDMTLTTNQYYTFIVIDDQTNVYCYLDGVLIASGARVSGEGAGWTNYYGCSIGCRGGGSTRDNHFSGDVDDVVFMSRVPTATEIKYISHGGQDLRITTDSAGTTEIPFEIVSLDAVAETAEIWTKVPTLDYDGATSIYLWYGNASATPYAPSDTYGSQNVWSSDYKSVLHLQEIVNNTSNGYVDSSGTAHHGTGTSMALTAPVGQIGIAQDFDGSADYITITDHADFEQANGSVSFWFKPDSTLNTGLSRVYYLTDKGDTYFGVRISKTVGHEGKLEFVLYDGSGHYARTTQTTWTGSTWYHFFGTWGSSGMKIYINGSADGTDAHTGGYTNVANNIRLAGNSENTTSLWDGKIDEWKFTSSQKTSDWATTEYNNQNDPSTFWTAITESPSPSLSPSLSPSVSPSVSVSLSPSASASPSSSVSLSPSRSPSLSPSPSSSVSLSPSRSPSASASPSSSISLSPSLSESRSPSRSPSASVSPSSSTSLSQSRSPSASASPSSSISLSPSSSSSKSPSPSASPSATPSPSPSRSPSLSPSPSSSVSLSPSVSESRSPSISVSLSPSLSESRSISLSPSPSSSVSLSPSVSESRSISLSESPSPSAGYEDYTRGNYVVLPTDDADLETNFSSQDYIDVSTDDSVRVEQLGSSEYMVFQFRNFVSDSVSCQVHWNGQSDLPPNVSTVYLQIYNQNTNEWETVDSDSSSSVNTDFDLYADILDLTNYRDALNVITCRVYQGAI